MVHPPHMRPYVPHDNSSMAELRGIAFVQVNWLIQYSSRTVACCTAQSTNCNTQETNSAFYSNQLATVTYLTVCSKAIYRSYGIRRAE